MIVAPSHRLETSKVGTSDEAAVLDWRRLKLGKGGTEPLFSVKADVAVSEWWAACLRLMVDSHRYQLRRAGASADMLARSRSAGENMARGRWSTVVSLRRYAQPGVYQRHLRRLPAETRAFGERSCQHLKQVVTEGLAVVVPVLQHLPVVGVAQ